MNLLLIENIRGSFVVTPIMNGKPQPENQLEFWNEKDLRSFCVEYEKWPYYAIRQHFAFKKQSVLHELAGTWWF